MTINRRSFLAGSCAGLSAASLGSLSATLNGFPAHAADVSGYKALVCVFLLGGMDNHDTLIPYDQSNWQAWSSLRDSVANAYATPRTRANLLPLSADNIGDFGGREFALPPEMAGLHGLFESGQAAIAANVGPLIRPMNADQYDNRSLPRPARLFSHNDQQSTWQASAPEGARFGWGGRFADAVLDAGANNNSAFTTITSLGNELFLTGERAAPYQVSLGGEAAFDLLNDVEEFAGGAAGDVEPILRRHFRAAGYSGSSLIGRDVAASLRDAFESNERFNAARAGLTPLTTAFADDRLSRQLQVIAETIALRGALGAGRQVFFAATGGFDTHSNQANNLARRQTEISNAITSFQAAMQELGAADEVTLFTASDFGRTLAINGDGTDHGWGADHFIVGGAVAGRRIYGDPPPPVFGHAQDAGGGRLIPTISVEQYAEPLGRWFGLTQDEVRNALPNLRNFETSPLLMV